MVRQSKRGIYKYDNYVCACVWTSLYFVQGRVSVVSVNENVGKIICQKKCICSSTVRLLQLLCTLYYCITLLNETKFTIFRKILFYINPKFCYGFFQKNPIFNCVSLKISQTQKFFPDSSRQSIVHGNFRNISLWPTPFFEREQRRKVC